MSGLRAGPLPALLVAAGSTLVGLTLVMAVSGVPLGSAAAASTLVSLGSLGAACLWSSACHRRMHVLEALGMGVALSTSITAVVLAGLAYLGVTLSAWLPALVLLVVGVVLVMRGVGADAAHPARLDVSGPATVAALIGIGGSAILAVPRLVQYPVGPGAAWSSYNQDLFFFETLSDAVARFGPAEGGLMADWPVRYHWLTYAFAGQVSESTGLGPFVALVRLLPLLSIIALACLAAAWASRYSRTWLVPTASVALLLWASSIGSTPNRVINWDSPSQSLGSVWLLALVMVVVAIARASHPGPLYAALALLSMAATAGKTSNGLLAASALGVAMVAGAVRRAPWTQHIAIALGVVILGSTVAFAAVTLGSAGSGALEPSPALLQLAGRTQAAGATFGALTLAATLLLAAAPRWAGLLAGWSSRSARGPLMLELGLASGAAGMAVLAVLTLAGTASNQSWFIDGACVMLAVPSGIALARAWTTCPPIVGHRRTAGLIAVTTGALFALVALVADRRLPDAYIVGFPSALVTLVVWWLALAAVMAVATASVHPWRGRLATVWVSLVSAALLVSSVTYGVGSVVVGGWPTAAPRDATVRTDAVVPALEWLRDAADPHDVVASDPDSMGLVSAVSGLRGYAEWQQYVERLSTSGGAGEFAERRAVISSALDGDARAGSTLCEDGVRWIVADADRPTPLPPAFTADGVTILRVACPSG